MKRRYAISGSRLIIFCNRSTIAGKDDLVSSDTSIADTNFYEIIGRGEVTKNVVIEDDVWIGANAMILPGAHIRKGSVVAAGSVVTKAFDEEAVLIAGNPARIVKHNVSWNL